MAEQQGQPLVSTTRQGTKDTGSEDTGKFPFEGWEFTLPQDTDPRVILRSPWKIAAAAWVTGTAAALATKNAVVPLGAIAFETDTLSFKIGDGTTAYNTLTYFYRGLPVAGEPSLGTPHVTSDTYRTATLVVDTSTNTAGVWSAAVTMTGVPVGAKTAWCEVSVVLAGSSCNVAVEAASGYTLSDITAGNNIFKYLHAHSDAAAITQRVPLKIHLDANGQFKWCTTNANTTVKIGSAIEHEE